MNMNDSLKFQRKIDRATDLKLLADLSSTDSPGSPSPHKSIVVVFKAPPVPQLTKEKRFVVWKVQTSKNGDCRLILRPVASMHPVNDELYLMGVTFYDFISSDNFNVREILY